MDCSSQCATVLAASVVFRSDHSTFYFLQTFVSPSEDKAAFVLTSILHIA
jgi:hypothetical protein